MGEPSVFDGMKEAEKLKYSECEIKRERQAVDVDKLFQIINYSKKFGFYV